MATKVDDKPRVPLDTLALLIFFPLILSNDGKGEIFVHQRSIDKLNPAAPGLGEGETLVFNVRSTPKGFEAVNVTGPNGEPVVGSKRESRRRVNGKAIFLSQLSSWIIAL
jgi:cold shock CspA family protein